METTPISLRKEHEAKQSLIFDRVHSALDFMDNYRMDNGRPLYDSRTIESVRTMISILKGWEEVYLDNAFRKGVDVGSDPERPDGLCNPDIYSYSNDFFKKGENDETK